MERFKGNLEAGGYVLALTVLILGKLIPFGMWKTAVTSNANLEEGACPMEEYLPQHYLKGC